MEFYLPDDVDALEVARLVRDDHADTPAPHSATTKRPRDAQWDFDEVTLADLSTNLFPTAKRARASSSAFTFSPFSSGASLRERSTSSLSSIPSTYSLNERSDGPTEGTVVPAMTVSATSVGTKASKRAGSKNKNAAPTRTASTSKPRKSKPTAEGPSLVVNDFRSPVTVSGVVLRPTVAFQTFWKWCAERKAIDDKRRQGLPAPWTEDKTLQNYFFCNSFRVLDKVCQYLITEVIEKGSQKEEEIVFRVILFNLFTKIETWEVLQAKLGPLTWASYERDRYIDVLQKANDGGMTLYTGAFIKPAPKFDQAQNYVNHLEFLEVLMDENITKICKNVKHMADLFEWLVSFPSLGDFSTYQLMLCLSYTKVLNFHPNDFVVAGPGSISGLKKLFGNGIAEHLGRDGFAQDVMRFMAENQKTYFELGGYEVIGLGPKKLPMDIADIEHALCEVDKYCRVVHPQISGKRTHLTRTFRPPGSGDESSAEVVGRSREYGPAVLPKAWSHPARKTPRIREDKKLVIEKRYIIEKIVGHRKRSVQFEPADETGASLVPDGDGYEYRVRWLWYKEKDDTWESGEHLSHEAPRILKEYKQEHMPKGRRRP